jgi:murein DD-endopeptidase MepM/ murein hydrolase activator NlpD
MARKRKGGKGGARRRNITGYGTTATAAPSTATTPPRPRRRRGLSAPDLGSMLIHLGIIWLVVGVLVQLGKGYVQRQTSADATGGTDSGTGTGGGDGDGSILKRAQQFAAKTARTSMSPDHQMYGGHMYAIPVQQLQPMEDYPNPLRITEEMRKGFHPVVMFDNNKKRKEEEEKSNRYTVMDFTQRQPDEDSGRDGRPTPGSLIPPDQWASLMKDRKKNKKKQTEIPFTVGRYDEDRRNMYSSDLFDASNGGDARTVHVGIDIGGPVGTKVHAFTDGIIHSAGHNPEWGDYGHVVVVEHELPASLEDGNDDDKELSSTSSKIYALYGHLDAGSIRGKKPGKKIKKGEVIGRMGDLTDNGGWYDPHVHFQLSINPPPTHDMPGVVSTSDRPKALVEYPDPRLILGSLY